MGFLGRGGPYIASALRYAGCFAMLLDLPCFREGNESAMQRLITMGSETWRTETIAVHSGVYKDKTFNSVTTPIYPSSNFYFDKVGVNTGYDYTRTANPTRKALEENLAALEGGAGCVATCTGMSALTTMMFLFKSGDHLITGNDIYGGSWRLFNDLAAQMGIEVSFVNMRDPELVTKSIKHNTRALFVETPSNPLLNIVDIAAMGKIAKEHGLLGIADNTFMSPLLQRPFELGMDIVWHSTTKYLNGHSDVVGGAIISKTTEMATRIAYLANALGTGCSPWDAWLVLRGVKTLTQRMEATQRNATAVAEFLNSHPRVKKVYFPGLPDHPGHELAKRQQKGFGGMLAFEIDSAQVSVDDFFARLKLFILAESLGGVESLIEQVWTMSHASMTEEARRDANLTPETIRVSLGIEHPDDLIDDLKFALEG